MANELSNTIPLKTVVKAVANDLRLDFGTTEATLNHWAVRVWDIIDTQYVRTSLKRVILPIHSSFKTGALPLDFKSAAFVGLINECGEKVSFRQKSNLTPTEINEVDCIDKCEKCYEGMDICEHLEVEVEKKTVIIEGVEKENTITKYLDGDSYYLVKDIWIYNTVTESVELTTTKEWITTFDMNDCGCIKHTHDNIEKVKNHCFSCYSICYTPCREDNEDLGGYRIIEENGLVYFDRNIPYDKFYLEYYGCLLKKNNEYHVPAITKEAIVEGVKYKWMQHRNDKGMGEKQWQKNEFILAKKNMFRILGRLSLTNIIKSINTTPKFDTISVGGYNYWGRNRNYGYANAYTENTSHNHHYPTPIPPTPPPVDTDSIELPTGATSWVVPRGTLLEIIWVISPQVLSVNIGTTDGGDDIINSYGDNNVTDLVNGATLEVNRPYLIDTRIYFSGVNSNTKIIIFKRKKPTT